MADLKERVEKVLLQKHCSIEHSEQYEGCLNCENEQLTLINDLYAELQAEREKKSDYIEKYKMGVPRIENKY